MTSATLRILTLVLPLGIAACSTTGRYPSLGIRDVERQNGSAQAAPGDGVPPITLPPASADLVTRLAGLVKTAQDADRRFNTDRGAATRAVASAGALGSDSWSAASIALAQLENSRSSAMAALAELDTLYADARDAAPAQESPSVKAIADARTQVSAIVSSQDETIAGLSVRLKS
ncbi:hypothetical protein [Novosphingobium sp. Leaf2]|uniref:hypothetical protein n=1 Tax=Novosphingobium sp. Leaf2 TaxID=1735670 RepID=UPI0006FCD709|nr:hypothetical protein [Novosphingobium sp. Leaf2]KQM18321.1 hypothetical protein ASE49_08880 [Novosphingobium sp. Leaf2]